MAPSSINTDSGYQSHTRKASNSTATATATTKAAADAPVKVESKRQITWAPLPKIPTGSKRHVTRAALRKPQRDCSHGGADIIQRPPLTPPPASKLENAKPTVKKAVKPTVRRCSSSLANTRGYTRAQGSKPIPIPLDREGRPNWHLAEETTWKDGRGLLYLKDGTEPEMRINGFGEMMPVEPVVERVFMYDGVGGRGLDFGDDDGWNGGLRMW